MRILAIDPGPTTCGVVSVDMAARRLVVCYPKATIDEALSAVAGSAWDGTDHVVIERVKAGRHAGDSYLQTSESVGRLWQMGIVAGVPVSLMYRTEVLRWLDLLGISGNRDSAVTRELISRFGGSTASEVKGTKNNPGPLYGISGHAWQALAVAEAHAESIGLRRSP